MDPDQGEQLNEQAQADEHAGQTHAALDPKWNDGGR
jgi:hypothetical protein